MFNWKKCNFLVRETIVLGHKVSMIGLELDKPKIEVIEKLPPLISVKLFKSFLGHVAFCRRFIEDFSKTARPMCTILEKEWTFILHRKCLEAF